MSAGRGRRPRSPPSRATRRVVPDLAPQPPAPPLAATEAWVSLRVRSSDAKAPFLVQIDALGNPINSVDKAQVFRFGPRAVVDFDVAVS